MTITEYLEAYLGNLIADLNISASQISFIVSEILSTYGVETEEKATDTLKLYAIAKMETWKYLMIQQTANFDVSSDGQSYKSSQIYDFCKSNYFNAYVDAYQYLDDGKIDIDQFSISGKRGCHEKL